MGETVGRSMWEALGEERCSGQCRVFHVLPRRDEYRTEMKFKASGTRMYGCVRAEISRAGAVRESDVKEKLLRCVGYACGAGLGGEWGMEACEAWGARRSVIQGTA